MNSLLETMSDLQKPQSTRSCRVVVSPPGNQPPPEYEQFPNDEKRLKDCLVTSRQPKRQVDVKIVRAMLGVTSCHISQWAPAPVHREDRALDQYQSSQNGRQTKLPPSTSEGNSHNAYGEEEPNRRV
jgi:hypothetical protein